VALAAPPAEAVAPAGVEGAAIGPNARVDVMRARLVQLKQPVYGTKQELWARLSKAERAHAAVLARDRELAERHAARAEGLLPAEVATIPAPYTPSQAERDLHELAHTPPAPWCEYCVMGEGTSDPHYKQHQDSKLAHPLVMIDHAFTAVESDLEAEKDLLSKSLICVDRDSGATLAFTVGSDVENAYALKKLLGWIKFLGHSTFELRTDNPPEMLKLQNDVLVARAKEFPKFRVITSQGKVMDSQSMGGVETSVRWWRSKFRVLRLFLQDKYGTHIGPTHPMWPWLVRHASFLNTRYRVRADGHTAFFNLTHHAYGGIIVPMGETVLAKLPASKARRRRGGLA